MRIRAKTNGNIVDLPEQEAQGLIRAGIYEAVDNDDGQDGSSSKPAEPPKQKRQYKRRDLTPEP